MMSHDEYLDLIARLDDLVAGFEIHPDFTTRERAIALLTAIDALHREGLHRLVDGLRAAGAAAALDRAAADPIVATLLGLYDRADLGLPPEPPALAPAPAAAFIPVDRLRRSAEALARGRRAT